MLDLVVELAEDHIGNRWVGYFTSIDPDENAGEATVVGIQQGARLQVQLAQFLIRGQCSPFLESVGQSLLAFVPALFVGPHGLRIVDVEEDVLFGASALEAQTTNFGRIVRQGDVNLEHLVGGASLRLEAIQADGRGRGEQQRDGAKGNAQAGTNFQAG
ncbi:hypothetical protein D3C86_1319820 [compost metagenome]